MITILSTPIILEQGDYKVREISLENALDFIQDKKVVNYSQHETVRLLGLEPAKERKICEGYETAICIKANGRLEFGREYTADEIKEIGYTIFYIRKE